MNAQAENPNKIAQIQSEEEDEDGPKDMIALRDRWMDETDASTKKYIKALESLKNKYEMKKDTKYSEIIKTEIERLSLDKNSDKFPEGTIKYKNHYYYMFPQSMTYDKAITACGELNGKLLHITDKKELNFIVKKFLTLKHKSAWLNSTKNEFDNWLDSNNEKIKFFNLNKAEPNGSVGYHINILPSGYYDDVSGDSNSPLVICKW